MKPSHFPQSDDVTISKVTETLDRALYDAHTSYVQSRKISKQEWIAGILLKELYKSGKGDGYDVASIIETKDSIWLYDLIWKGITANDESLLVVECELGTEYRAIRNDFKKLLMARAKLRLLITYGGEDIKDMERALGIVTKLKEKIEYGSLSQAGERFLFATIIADGRDGYFFQYEFVKK